MVLVGANGQGKSTLLRLMLGELAPGVGLVTQHPQAKVGLFAQNNVEALVVGQGKSSALQHLKQLHPEGLCACSFPAVMQPSSLAVSAAPPGAAKEQELRNHLGSFGIKGHLATQRMSALSGGQAVRVGLAAAALSCPQLLVLVCA